MPKLPAQRKKMARSGRAGLTLIELLVGAAITLIILGAVMAMLLAVQASYHRESGHKEVIEGGRVGGGYLERVLRFAGYGVPPPFAFDFDTPGTVVKDSTTDSDDLAFRYRDPTYQRRGYLDVAGTGLALSAGNTFGMALRALQPLLIVCPGADQWRVVSLDAAVAANGTTATVSAHNPFPGNADVCLRDSTNPPYVTLLHEKRIRVVDSRLLVFHSLADPASNTNFDPIAEGVETFQVAYVMNRPPPGTNCCATAVAPDDNAGANASPDWVFGNQEDDGAFPTGNAGPIFGTAYDDQLRYNGHAANIRQVRVNLVLRAAETGRERVSAPAVVENWTPASLAPDNFYRLTVTTAVGVPNLASRGFFVPLVGTGSPNVNGG